MRARGRRGEREGRGINAAVAPVVQIGVRESRLSFVWVLGFDVAGIAAGMLRVLHKGVNSQCSTV